MKKVLFIMVCVFGLTAACNTLLAQDSPNEFYLGYGPGAASFQSFDEASNSFLDGVFSGIFTGESSNQTSTSIGIFSFGYNRFISKKIKLGFNANYTSINNGIEYSKNGAVVRHIKWSDDFLSFMLRADFHYVKKENLSMYSGLAVGVSFITSKEGAGAEGLSIPANTAFAFQINGFGIRVGKGFGFFAEVGFGYLGILNAGFNIRF
jgi:hypothetical protein